LTDIIVERNNTGLEADRINSRGTEEEKRLRSLQDQIQLCESMIKSAKEREHALVPYGRNIKSILEPARAS
jgi:hypothetical protein